MTHGVPADFADQVQAAARLARVRKLELYGVIRRDGRFVGLTRTPEKRGSEEAEAPRSSRGVQAMLI